LPGDILQSKECGAFFVLIRSDSAGRPCFTLLLLRPENQQIARLFCTKRMAGSGGGSRLRGFPSKFVAIKVCKKFREERVGGKQVWLKDKPRRHCEDPH